MLIYIRLFLGMGITWYFEILNFALSSLEPDPRWLIFTDTLNMCQVAQITQDLSFIKLYQLYTKASPSFPSNFTILQENDFQFFFQTLFMC